MTAPPWSLTSKLNLTHLLLLLDLMTSLSLRSASIAKRCTFLLLLGMQNFAMAAKNGIVIPAVGYMYAAEQVTKSTP